MGVRDTFASLGTANGCCYLLGRALARLTGGRAHIISYRFMAQPIPTKAPPLPAGATSIEEVGPQHPLVAHFPRPPEVVRWRFEQGYRCLLATHKGEFAGFLWLAHREYEEDEVRCRFRLAAPGRCVWDFDVYVEPRFRLGRTFSRLWQAANHALHEEGYEWSLSRISTFNPGSLAAHSRLGATPVGQAVFICLGSLQLAVLPWPAGLHLSLHAGSRPTLLLAAPGSGHERSLA